VIDEYHKALQESMDNEMRDTEESLQQTNANYCTGGSAYTDFKAYADVFSKGPCNPVFFSR